MDLTHISDNWHTVRGSGSLKTPEENLSLCVEVFIQHHHFDEASTIDNAAGIMVDRHIWKDRRIKMHQSPSRDCLGEDEIPTGAFISLAAQARGDDGLGGELYHEKVEQGSANDPSLTAHQREWDYLERHVQAAYEAYPRHANSWPGESLSEWQKVEALARYAMQWKMKSSEVYSSFHPVDVLFHSSYCTGVAAILQALALVAGFPARFICISNHSMIEIYVNGRWIWADNCWSSGGITPSTFNYADMTADPFSMPSLNARQQEVYASHTARYRSPYHYAGTFYWHFASGAAKGRGIRNDVVDGFGLSVPYDPSTAAALYPEMKHHSFFTPYGWSPTVNICEKGSLIQSSFTLTSENALRKVFYIGDCLDNPISGGIAKFRLSEVASADDFICTLDGQEVTCTGIGIRYEKPSVDFELPANMLTSGTHELCISMKKGSAHIVLYPDIVEPYFPPHYGEKHIAADETFTVDHFISPEDIEKLREPLVSLNTAVH